MQRPSSKLSAFFSLTTIAWSVAAAGSTIASPNTKIPLSASDLVRLSEIGPSYPGPGEHIFALSPDQKMAVVQVRTPDPSSNRYLIRLDVIDLSGSGHSRTIDEGGDIRLQYVSGIGGVTVSTGYVAATPLAWSSDGRFVYFLKRSVNTTQVWRAATNGAGSEPITHEKGEVQDFLLLDDDRRLVYSSRQRDPGLEAAVSAEALRGFRFDSRFVPLFDNRPQGSVSTLVTKTINLSTGQFRTATVDEESDLLRHDKLRTTGPVATSNSGETAFISTSEDQKDPNSGRISVRQVNDKVQICASADCVGALAVWWTADGDRVRYIRRDGWADSEMAIFEWQPGRSAPKRLYITQDLLIDCQALGQGIACARERSADPRQIVLLNPDSGRVKVVFDPNQGFNRFSTGKIERLNWRNEFGIETFGDLIYPIGYIKGRAYPLIVVQYLSRGFLKGGVGDEFPIQLFATNGYAVLSIQRPNVGSLKIKRDDAQTIVDHSYEKLKDRQSVLSSIEIGVNSLIARGIIDARHIGITGLSDGSSTVQFALVNSSMFSAASASGCCWDLFQDAIVGPSAADAYHDSGWPTLLNYDSTFWRHISLVKNARRVSTPLLIQQADDEFRAAMASYTALQQAGKAVDLFVFPGEHHVKWQPAHRLAVYERNLRWFNFWLKGKFPSDPDGQKEAAHWLEMMKKQ